MPLPSAPPINTNGSTTKFLSWLRSFADANDGMLPEFSNAEAGQVMGLLNSHARHRGSVQSRIDFACYLCGLPPLGLAADQPYPRAWNADHTGWQFPIEQMTQAVRHHRWTSADFNKLSVVLGELGSRASKLWQEEIKSNLKGIENWAFGFAKRGVPHTPASASKRNPDWSRDELILALRLYMRHRSSIPAKGGVEIAQLSRLLRRMVERTTHSASYRNTDGVYMKLMNFRSIDPLYKNQQKVGLKNNAKDELRVWTLYAEDVPALEAAADAIEAAINAPTSETGIDIDDEDDIEECEEGRVLTRMHRYRERSRKLVSQFKDRARKLNGGTLACAGCDLDFAQKYGTMADRLIDVHHTKPVHTLKPGDKTKSEDLVLLCVSCHRAVHSCKQWLTIPELRRRIGKT